MAEQQMADKYWSKPQLIRLTVAAESAAGSCALYAEFALTPSDKTFLPASP